MLELPLPPKDGGHQAEIVGAHGVSGEGAQAPGSSNCGRHWAEVLGLNEAKEEGTSFLQRKECGPLAGG